MARPAEHTPDQTPPPVARRGDVLPASLPPRGLNRVQSAAYIGVSPNFFDALRKAGQMPRPKTVGSRLVWDRVELDEAFSALPSGEEEPNVAVGDAEGHNPWDDED